MPINHDSLMAILLYTMYHKVSQYMDDRLSTIIVCCDISKAFDSVWHDGFIKKLKSNRI